MTEDNIFERDIDGHSFVVVKKPAAAQMMLQLKIMNIAGGSVGGISKFKMPEKGDDPKEWISIVGQMMSSTDPEKAMGLILEICSMSRVRFDDQLKNVDKNVFNQIFSSNLIGAYKLVGFVLEAQFKDFLAPVLAKLESMKTQNKKTETTKGGALPQ